MANLGSEVARLYKAMDSHSYDRAAESRARALHIIDELLAGPQTKGRTGEVIILKDIIENVSEAEPELRITGKELEAYFMPFAMKTLQNI